MSCDVLKRSGTFRQVPHNKSFKPSPHRHGNERTVDRAGRLNSSVRLHNSKSRCCSASLKLIMITYPHSTCRGWLRIDVAGHGGAIDWHHSSTPASEWCAGRGLARTVHAPARRLCVFALVWAPSDTTGKWHGSGNSGARGGWPTCPALTASCNLTSRSSRRCFVAATACIRYASTRCRHYRSAA